MTGWVPDNDVERALLAAAAEDDRRGYFQLVAAAELYLPRVRGDDRHVTVRAFGQTFLPVFTSVRTLADRFSGAVDGWAATTYPRLQRAWPDPDWRLAVNPGTPVDAYLRVGVLADAAVGDADVPTLAELAAAAEDDDAAERRLRDRFAAGLHPGGPGGPAAELAAAAAAGDAYGYLESLLDAVVLVPTARPADPAELLEPGFPWRSVPGPAVQVFSGAAALERAYPGGVPSVAVALPFALAVWPAGHGMTVDQGAAHELHLGPEEVRLLLAVPPGPALEEPP